LSLPIRKEPDPPPLRPEDRTVSGRPRPQNCGALRTQACVPCRRAASHDDQNL